MNKHEEKICGRCSIPFECKVGSIELCQCRVIEITDAERAYVQSKFSDCLCVSCLDELSSEFRVQQFNASIRKISGAR